MSLNYIGISHFPVLHRQFSSPTSTVSLDSPRTSNQDLTQDNKDVLIERLNDLVFRLFKDSSVEDSIVSAIHTRVDGVELLLKNKEIERHKKSTSLGNEISSESGEDPFWGPLTPTRNGRILFPESPTSPRHSREATTGKEPRPSSYSREAAIGIERVIEIAKSAEELASKLKVTVAELQVRKQESDHIHDLLITRVEMAAERILMLEYRVKEMEEDFDANQSELKFLRIQLQAIEAQSSQYILQDIDPDLSQSIVNWKHDWEDIDRRSKAMRKKFHSSSDSLDTSHGTLTDGSVSG